MDDTLERLGEAIAGALPGSVVGHWVAHGELTLTAFAPDIIKVIQANGWTEVRTRGSHRHFVHPRKPGLVTIAGHAGHDVPPTTLRQIFRQAGLDWSRRPR